MDSRYQSIPQEVLNHIVNLINAYMRDSSEDVLSKEELQNAMRYISKYIYDYADMQVDVDAIVSKKNILSIDIVPLPNLDEVVVVDHGGYPRLVEAILQVLDNQEKQGNGVFVGEIRGILSGL